MENSDGSPRPGRPRAKPKMTNAATASRAAAEGPTKSGNKGSVAVSRWKRAPVKINTTEINEFKSLRVDSCVLYQSPTSSQEKVAAENSSIKKTKAPPRRDEVCEHPAECPQTNEGWKRPKAKSCNDIVRNKSKVIKKPEKLKKKRRKDKKDVLPLLEETNSRHSSDSDKTVILPYSSFGLLQDSLIPVIDSSSQDVTPLNSERYKTEASCEDSNLSGDEKIIASNLDSARSLEVSESFLYDVRDAADLIESSPLLDSCAVKCESVNSSFKNPNLDFENIRAIDKSQMYVETGFKYSNPSDDSASKSGSKKSKIDDKILCGMEALKTVTSKKSFKNSSNHSVSDRSEISIRSNGSNSVSSVRLGPDSPSYKSINLSKKNTDVDSGTDGEKSPLSRKNTCTNVSCKENDIDEKCSSKSFKSDDNQNSRGHLSVSSRLSEYFSKCIQNYETSSSSSVSIVGSSNKNCCTDIVLKDREFYETPHEMLFRAINENQGSLQHRECTSIYKETKNTQEIRDTAINTSNICLTEKINSHKSVQIIFNDPKYDDGNLLLTQSGTEKCSNCQIILTTLQNNLDMLSKCSCNHFKKTVSKTVCDPRDLNAVNIEPPKPSYTKIVETNKSYDSVISKRSDSSKKDNKGFSRESTNSSFLNIFTKHEDKGSLSDSELYNKNRVEVTLSISHRSQSQTMDTRNCFVCNLKNKKHLDVDINIQEQLTPSPKDKPNSRNSQTDSSDNDKRSGARRPGGKRFDFDNASSEMTDSENSFKCNEMTPNYNNYNPSNSVRRHNISFGMCDNVSENILPDRLKDKTGRAGSSGFSDNLNRLNEIRRLLQRRPAQESCPEWYVDREQSGENDCTGAHLKRGCHIENEHVETIVYSEPKRCQVVKTCVVPLKDNISQLNKSIAEKEINLRLPSLKLPSIKSNSSNNSQPFDFCVSLPPLRCSSPCKCLNRRSPNEGGGDDGSRDDVLSKFCHECGGRYPVPSAKFCCVCGVRRISI